MKRKEPRKSAYVGEQKMIGKFLILLTAGRRGNIASVRKGCVPNQSDSRHS
jgi:hypothetical protein